MGIERDALFGDFPQDGQGKDLKASGIRQDRPVPGHEAVQPTHVADELVSGPHVEMIGIRELDLTADGL
jgi:hypothetical protein